MGGTAAAAKSEQSKLPEVSQPSCPKPPEVPTAALLKTIHFLPVPLLTLHHDQLMLGFSLRYVDYWAGYPKEGLGKGGPRDQEVPQHLPDGGVACQQVAQEVVAR